jgi:5-methylthioadenosine/S-adenosylhomocysteine deaminase
MPLPTVATTRFGLMGRIVTMDTSNRIIPSGTVYVDLPNIAAVVEQGGELPKGFENVPVIDTQGTICPGLIELHNHLSYNALRLWAVPQKFDNRDQWQKSADYAEKVTGPMKVIGHSKDPQLLPALVRFVGAKCLVAGVTTSQGIALSSNMGIERYYKGIVRSVEEPDDPLLPKANTRIPDLAAKDWESFDDELKKSSCFLIHLSEGLDSVARTHFLALQQGNTWAITNALSGIHCAGLQRADFDVMAQRGASMVWSPLSNYILYGGTAKVSDAKNAGLRIALGSDWSPSGSKNLLGELKVAKVVNEGLGRVFSDQELVAMVTRTAAEILTWDRYLGSIQKDKRADLLVISGASGDAYGSLIEAAETQVALVVIAGKPRFGTSSLMSRLSVSGETIQIAGCERVAAWDDVDADPDVESIPLEKSVQILSDVFQRLPTLAADEQSARGALDLALKPSEEPRVRLSLDEQDSHGFDLRPYLPYEGKTTGGSPPLTLAKAQQLPLVPLKLDSLTAADDASFATELQAQKNLPAFLKDGLKKYFGEG